MPGTRLPDHAHHGTPVAPIAGELRRLSAAAGGDHRLGSRYGLETTFGRNLSCENEVANQLVELYARASELARLVGRSAADEFFNAEQNARLVRPLTPRP